MERHNISGIHSIRQTSPVNSHQSLCAHNLITKHIITADISGIKGNQRKRRLFFLLLKTLGHSLTDRRLSVGFLLFLIAWFCGSATRLEHAAVFFLDYINPFYLGSAVMQNTEWSAVGQSELN